MTANAGNGFSYQWFKNATPILNATSITYSAYLNGIYTVEVTDSNTCSKLSTGKLVLIICIPVDPPNERNSITPETFTLQPNPVKDKMQVGDLHFSGAIKIRIINTLGVAVFEDFLEAAPAIEVGVSHLANGVYLLEMSDQNKTSVKKFVKQ
jgi:hypothetical protein